MSADNKGPKFSEEEATARELLSAMTGVHERDIPVNPVGSERAVKRTARLIEGLTAAAGATSETVAQGKISDLPAERRQELEEIGKALKAQGVRGGIDI